MNVMTQDLNEILILTHYKHPKPLKKKYFTIFLKHSLHQQSLLYELTNESSTA